jgi:hypothetical protein
MRRRRSATISSNQSNIRRLPGSKEPALDRRRAPQKAFRISRSRPAEPDGQLAGAGGLVPQAEAPNTEIANANASWTNNPKLDVVLSPPGFLKLAAGAAAATVSQRNVNGKKYTVVSFPVEQKAASGVPYTISGYIDSDNMVAKVETRIEDALIGDMLVEQTYSGYKDFGGVKFPTKIVQTRGRLAWSDLPVADVKANVPAPAAPAAPGGRGAGGGRGGAAAPAEGRGGAPAGGRGGAAAAPAITSKKLADGIYIVNGAYRSVAVEMKDHIVLLEAPQNEMTTMNIIAEVKKVIPNKPITLVVNTHTHSDHSGHIKSAHAEDLLIVYLPKIKAVFEGDAFNPPAANALPPVAVNGFEKLFAAKLDELKLDVNSIISVHQPGGDDRDITKADLLKSIGKEQ